MKKHIPVLVFSFYLLFFPAFGVAQHHGGHNCGNCPHHQQHAAQGRQQAACGQHDKEGLPAEITLAFPTAKSVKKEAKWTAVYDAKQVLLGYAVYSKPASNGIKGYAGETPLMVALSPKQEILCVTLLDNMESPGFLARVMEAGLLKSWDGLKPAKAKKKKVDTVSGATFSSRSIIETLQAALKTL